jgi:hypothetical protein
MRVEVFLILSRLMTFYSCKIVKTYKCILYNSQLHGTGRQGNEPSMLQSCQIYVFSFTCAMNIILRFFMFPIPYLKAKNHRNISFYDGSASYFLFISRKAGSSPALLYHPIIKTFNVLIPPRSPRRTSPFFAADFPYAVNK